MKTKNNFCLLILCIISGCAGVRVTTNGVKVPLATLPSAADSILVVGRYDHIDLGSDAKPIASSRIQGPLQDMKTPALQHYSKLKNLAMRECQRLGGNVVVVNDYHNLYTSSHSSSDIVIDIYRLTDQGLEYLKHQRAAIKTMRDDSLKDMCLVHVQFAGKPMSQGFEVFFNGKLQYSPSSSVNGFSVRNDVYTFSWPEGGKFVARSKRSPGEQRDLQLGKEYFYYIYKNRLDDVMVLDLTKDQFENDLFRPRSVTAVPAK